jgi:hypothetical protein
MRVKVGLNDAGAAGGSVYFRPNHNQADPAVRLERRDQIAEIGLMEFGDHGAQERNVPRRFDRNAQFV